MSLDGWMIHSGKHLGKQIVKASEEKERQGKESKGKLRQEKARKAS